MQQVQEDAAGQEAVQQWEDTGEQVGQPFTALDSGGVFRVPQSGVKKWRRNKEKKIGKKKKKKEELCSPVPSDQQ